MLSTRKLGAAILIFKKHHHVKNQHLPQMCTEHETQRMGLLGELEHTVGETAPVSTSRSERDDC